MIMTLTLPYYGDHDHDHDHDHYFDRDLVQGEPEAGEMSLYGLQLPRLYEEGPRERQVGSL